MNDDPSSSELPSPYGFTMGMDTEMPPMEVDETVRGDDMLLLPKG